MIHSHSEVWTHLVLSTKNHQTIFKEKYTEMVKQALLDFFEKFKENLGSYSILSDHIHMLFRLPVYISIEDFATQFQHLVSDRLKQAGVKNAEAIWESDFHVHSVSLNRLSSEKSFIEKQEIKHKEMSLAEELKFLGL